MKRLLFTLLLLSVPAFGQVTYLPTISQTWYRQSDGSGNDAGVVFGFSGAGIFHADTFQHGTAPVPDINLFAGSPFSGQTPRLLLEPNYGITTLMHNTDNFITFSPSAIQGVRLRTDGSIYFEFSEGYPRKTIIGQFNKDTDPDHTSLQLYDANSGTLKRVTVGEPDSCGPGYRCLKISN